ncbi:hypothetical protein BDR26DRAFT_910598 [Obelidium mucronatum]|nr:hypothetical protein BDR26DRAFT_910598 [Obelidium mucronatum]
MATTPSTKVAIVIGASRGIGAHIAAGLAAAGFAVVATGRAHSSRTAPTTAPPDFASPLSTAQSVCETINAETINATSGAAGVALPLACDVCSGASIAALFETVAGCAGARRLAETPVKRYALMNSVNQGGLYAAVQAALPLFKKAKRGRFLVVSPPIYSRFFRGKTAYADGERIAITSLWPATAIQSAVTEVKNIPKEYLRHPRIFADAAVSILNEPPKTVNGLALIDQDYLRDYRGVSDFSQYRLVPNSEPPRMMPKRFPSLLVEEQEDRGFSVDEKKAKL